MLSQKNSGLGRCIKFRGTRMKACKKIVNDELRSKYEGEVPYSE